LINVHPKDLQSAKQRSAAGWRKNLVAVSQLLSVPVPSTVSLLLEVRLTEASHLKGFLDMFNV